MRRSEAIRRFHMREELEYTDKIKHARSRLNYNTEMIHIKTCTHCVIAAL